MSRWCCCLLQDALAKDDVSDDDDDVFETVAGEDVDDEETMEAEVCRVVMAVAVRCRSRRVASGRDDGLAVVSTLTRVFRQERALGNSLKQQQAMELQELEADNEL